MRQLHDRPAPSEEEELSFARAAAFFVTLAIVAVLALVGSAQAAAPVKLSGPLASASAEDDEAAEEAFDFGAEEAEEAEDCVEEELEDGEWETCEEDAGAAADSECVVQSASATISAAASGKLRLTIRYRSAASALVSVAYRLRGGKGSLDLGGERTRFGRNGVYRETETLAEEELAKVLAAKEFTVALYAVNTPRRCRDELERHLTLRKAVPGGVLWAEPSARQGRL